MWLVRTLLRYPILDALSLFVITQIYGGVRCGAEASITACFTSAIVLALLLAVVLRIPLFFLQLVLLRYTNPSRYSQWTKGNGGVRVVFELSNDLLGNWIGLALVGVIAGLGLKTLEVTGFWAVLWGGILWLLIETLLRMLLVRTVHVQQQQPTEQTT